MVTVIRWVDVRFLNQAEDARLIRLVHRVIVTPQEYVLILPQANNVSTIIPLVVPKGGRVNMSARGLAVCNWVPVGVLGVIPMVRLVGLRVRRAIAVIPTMYVCPLHVQMAPHAMDQGGV